MQYLIYCIIDYNILHNCIIDYNILHNCIILIYCIIDYKKFIFKINYTIF